MSRKKQLKFVADATRAVDLNGIHQAFLAIESTDNCFLMVTDVNMGLTAYAAMMKEKDKLIDIGEDSQIVLWGARVHIENEGLLVIWDEEILSENDDS